MRCGILFLLSGSLSSPAAPGARAELKDAAGQVRGTATLTDTGHGIKMVVAVKGQKPGAHGFHIHAVGKCEGPDFKSAGGHFNPGAKKHGHDNPEGAHAGDLPNLDVDATGNGKAEIIIAGVTFGADAKGLFGKDGTAVVIHADQDDGKTDPAGNAGARILCGVITY